MKILFVGEIVSSPGREAVKEALPGVIKEHMVDLVITNAENLSGGRGFNTNHLEEMKQIGIDYFTGGDHIFWQKESQDLLESMPIIRPANYPGDPPGEGHALIDLGSKGKVLLINVMGRTSFSSIFSYLDDPFRKTDEILTRYKDEDLRGIIVDFHAESTSEKMAFGFFIDGRVDAVVGTHTHIPSADPTVMPKNTLYITDVGMTGNIDSVLGVKKEIILELFLTARNQKFDWEKTGRKAFRSVLLDLKEKSIIRVDKLF